MGGINKIYPLKLSEIKTFNDIADSKVNSFEVYALEALDVDNDEITYSENQKTSKAGDYFTASLEAFYLKDQYEIGNWINTNKNYRFVVVIVYNNGIIKVAGTLQQPLKLTSNPASGSVNNANGIGISFSEKMLQRAYYLDALPTIVAS